MQRHLLWSTFGTILFVAGFGFGFLAGGGGTEPAIEHPGQGDASGRRTGGDALVDSPRRRRAEWSDRRSRRGSTGANDPDERHDDAEGASRDAGETIDRLARVLAEGDIDAAHGLLHELARPGADPLSPAEVERLGGLVLEAPPHLAREIARALASSGGPEGLARVMGFASDVDLPLNVRRAMLDGLEDLPPEAAGRAFDALAGFLEAGPPRQLEHVAAHSLARLSGDRGAAPLLELMEDRPGIRPEILFDAIGDVGRVEDIDQVLGQIGASEGRGERASILRAAARIAARGGRADAMLDLMRTTPEGLSSQEVARAIAEAGEELGTGFLRDALAAAGGDPRSQEPLARAIAHSGGREGLDMLLEATSDPTSPLDPNVLARALEEYPGREAIPVMVDLFDAVDDPEAFESLARRLARSGDADAMQEVVSRLEDPELPRDRRREAAWALHESDPSQLAPERILDLLRHEQDREVAHGLAESLRELHPDFVRERASELLDGATGPAEKLAVARLMEESPGPEAADQLARHLRAETDDRTRWELSRILGELGDDGVARVDRILRDEPDPGRRHPLLEGLSAAEGAGSDGARELVLRAAREDPSPDIRMHATEILAERYGPAVAPGLAEIAASESNPEVRERMRHALERLEEGR